MIRYGPDGQGDTLGTFPAPEFPARAAVLDQRPGEPSRLMGADRSEAGMQVFFYVCADHNYAPMAVIHNSSTYEWGNGNHLEFVKWNAVIHPEVTP